MTRFLNWREREKGQREIKRRKGDCPEKEGREKESVGGKEGREERGIVKKKRGRESTREREKVHKNERKCKMSEGERKCKMEKKGEE